MFVRVYVCVGLCAVCRCFGTKIANLVFVVAASVSLLVGASCMPANRVCGLVALLASCHLVARKRSHYWLPLLVSFLLMAAPAAVNLARKRETATKSTTSLISPSCPNSSISSLPPLVFPTTSDTAKKPRADHISFIYRCGSIDNEW